MDQAGRDDPCPCGSGKKFKKCCIGRPLGAAVKLVESEGSEKWSIKLMNFAKFDEALGTEVITAFSRCFLHADRLVGLYILAGASRDARGKDSIAFTRDLHTMVWFAIGTLRELALALRDLRAALAKKKILNPKSPHWERLRELENRWDGDPKFREARNMGAFHVDQELMQRGVAVLVKDERDVELSQGEGGKQIESSFTLATAVLHNGIGWELAEYGSFLQLSERITGSSRRPYNWPSSRRLKRLGSILRAKSELHIDLRSAIEDRRLDRIASAAKATWMWSL